MNVKKYLVSSLLMISLVSIVVGCNWQSQLQDKLSTKTVSIVNQGSHYRVVLDYTKGVTPRQMGEKYGKAIVAACPDYEKLVDQSIAGFIRATATAFLQQTPTKGGREVHNSQLEEFSKQIYGMIIGRIPGFKANLNPKYRDEIEGIAAQLSGGTTNAMDDGKLSEDEVFLLNLFPDAGRAAQCTGLSVYGPRSNTGRTLTARVLDWTLEISDYLSRIQAVTFIKNREGKSICLIGFLGFQSVLSGFNEDGVFGAIMDAGTDQPYVNDRTDSYVMDLRYALENCYNLTEVANLMMDPQKQYAFNHLVYLADPDSSRVLENNISGTGSNMRRALRDDTSELNKGIQWGYQDMIAAVNAFMLKGNHNNFNDTNPFNARNPKRWESLLSQLNQHCGSGVGAQSYGSGGRCFSKRLGKEELKEIISYYHGATPSWQSEGDIYNIETQQILIFEPDQLKLEVFFRPSDGKLPSKPNFERIPVMF